MDERKERSQEIVQQIKRDPSVEKELSGAVYPILQKAKISVRDDEILVFVPRVLDKPRVIWEVLHPCRLGICPPDWLRIKESVAKMFSVERLENLKKILS